MPLYEILVMIVIISAFIGIVYAIYRIWVPKVPNEIEKQHDKLKDELVKTKAKVVINNIKEDIEGIKKNFKDEE